MSEAKLRELGNEILQVVAGKQLETEIAIISLEGIQQMFESAKSRASCEDDPQSRAYAPGSDDLGRFPDIFYMGYLDPRVQDVPFMYHNGSGGNQGRDFAVFGRVSGQYL